MEKYEWGKKGNVSDPFGFSWLLTQANTGGPAIDATGWDSPMFALRRMNFTCRLAGMAENGKPPIGRSFAPNWMRRPSAIFAKPCNWACRLGASALPK